MKTVRTPLKGLRQSIAKEITSMLDRAELPKTVMSFASDLSANDHIQAADLIYQTEGKNTSWRWDMFSDRQRRHIVSSINLYVDGYEAYQAEKGQPWMVRKV